MTFASRFPVHRERNTMLRLRVCLANAFDQVFIGTTAFATVAMWRRHRSTSTQQHSQDETTYYVQGKTPATPIQILFKGALPTCDGYHI
jgi:hypothetical protein